MFKKKEEYFKVYNFTNENVACLKDLYNFENAKVLTVIGSGDQYFSSVLNGAKEVDIFDINPSAYLYFCLKFFSIRELNYEEFYDFLIRKNVKNVNVYNKLEQVLPKDVLAYYKYLITNGRQIDTCFRQDGVTLLSRINKKYYFDSQNPIIPYIIKENYYKLQELLKKIKFPRFYPNNIVYLTDKINSNYDVLLLSNVYNFISFNVEEYTNLLNGFNVPEIQACYDWNGWYLNEFFKNGYSVNEVVASSPLEFGKKTNYVYSLKK